MSGSPALESLLVLQERDLALDRLQHRRDTLAERDAIARGDVQAASIATRLQAVRSRRDELAREENRLDDEARSLEGKAKDVEAKMYSGEVTSPRELQAMQADVDQLQRHQRDVENRELELMEQREPLDEELAALGAQQRTLTAELQTLRHTLAAAEHDDRRRDGGGKARAGRDRGIARRRAGGRLRAPPGAGARRRGRPAGRQHLSGLPSLDPVHGGRAHPQVGRRDDRALRQLRLHPGSVSPDGGASDRRDEVTVFFDGGARGNPGPAAIGAVVLDSGERPTAWCSRP